MAGQVTDEEIAADVFTPEAGLVLIEEAHDSGVLELTYRQAVYAIRAHVIGGSGAFELLVAQRQFAAGANGAEFEIIREQ